MKKLAALLLVVAFLFGFGFTVAHTVEVGGTPVADPGGAPSDPPPVWPPVQNSPIKL